MIPFSFEVLLRAIQSDLNFEPQAKAKINHLQVLQKAWKKLHTEFLGSRPDLIFLEIPRICSAHKITY